MTLVDKEAALSRKESTKTYTSGPAAVRVRMYTSEVDFHKPGIYGGRVLVWANPWDVFHCSPSRVVAVAGCCGYLSWCVLGAAGFFCVFFSFSLLRTHTAYVPQVRGHLSSCTSLLVPGCVQGAIIYFFCLYVCLCMCDIRRFY